MSQLILNRIQTKQIQINGFEMQTRVPAFVKTNCLFIFACVCSLGLAAYNTNNEKLHSKIIKKDFDYCRLIFITNVKN